jgi:ankyrin repeat protein
MISLSLRKTAGENTPLCKSEKSSPGEEAARPGLYDSMLQPIDASVLKPTDAEISSGTALVEAAKAGNLSEVKRLIASGDVKGFINAADEDDKSPDYRRATSMSWAAKYGHLDILKALIGARADVNLASQHQKSNVETNVTPISVAAVTGHTEAIRALLQAGADVNIPSEGRKFTAIHWAAMHGHAEAISALIQGGADPNIGDKFGRTPLSMAAQNRHLDATEALFQGGADPRKMGYACRIYLVNWNDSHTQIYDSGRAAWYYVLVEPERIPAFLKAMNDKIVNVVNYGKILLSGEGTDPPARVEKVLEEYGLKTPQEQEAGLKTLLKDLVRALSTINPKTEGRLEMLRARADKLVQSRAFGTVGIMFSSDNGTIVITDVKPDSHAALCDIQVGQCAANSRIFVAAVR